MQSFQTRDIGRSPKPYDFGCAGEVARFIDCLAQLRAAEWITAIPDGGAEACDAALAKLESLTVETGQRVAAWCATDGVETAAHLAFRRSTGNAQLVARKSSAIRAAQCAALALLLRSALSPEEFARLYGAFDALIPLRDLS
jgi:hypothetical protein